MTRIARTRVLHTRITDDNRFAVNDYVIIASLGRGSFGEVTLCEHITDKSLFVRLVFPAWRFCEGTLPLML